jgi:electron transfer flavoprotein alpha/beta subunit
MPMLPQLGVETANVKMSMNPFDEIAVEVRQSMAMSHTRTLPI